MGHGDWAAGLAGNANLAALVAGDWDRAIAYREDFDGPHLSPQSRFALHGWAWVVEAFRGGDASDVLSRPLAAERIGASATQESGAVHAVTALVRFAAGDLERVADEALEAYHRYPELEGSFAVLTAARAAILRRDTAGLRRVLEALDPGVAAGGTWLVTRRALARAAFGWLEGRAADAEAAYRQALVTFRSMDLPAEIAFTELEMLALGGDALADREALRVEAVGILRDLGVRPLLTRLDHLVAEPGTTPATSERTRMGVAAPR